MLFALNVYSHVFAAVLSVKNKGLTIVNHLQVQNALLYDTHQI